MKISKMSLAVAAAALVGVSPVIAAAPMSAPIVKANTNARVGAKTGAQNQVVGGSLILIILAGAAVAGGIVAATDDGGDDDSASD